MLRTDKHEKSFITSERSFYEHSILILNADTVPTLHTSSVHIGFSGSRQNTILTDNNLRFHFHAQLMLSSAEHEKKSFITLGPASVCLPAQGGAILKVKNFHPM